MEYGVCVQRILMQTKDPSSWTLLYQNYSLVSATAYKNNSHYRLAPPHSYMAQYISVIEHPCLNNGHQEIGGAST